MTERSKDETAEFIRSETGRWLGKAIGLIKDPQDCYQQQIRELWKDEPREPERINPVSLN